MSTVAEIEAAIEQLPPEEWQAIRRWMAQHSPRTVLWTMPPPPNVPLEELIRIEKLVEEEFSKIEDGW